MQSVALTGFELPFFCQCSGTFQSIMGLPLLSYLFKLLWSVIYSTSPYSAIRSPQRLLQSVTDDDDDDDDDNHTKAQQTMQNYRTVNRDVLE